MSIIPAGSTGYADYQRNTAADGPVLASYEGYINSAYVGDYVPVGQYWGTSTVIQTPGAAADFGFEWVTALTDGNVVGGRVIHNSGAVSNYIPVVLPNLGPYVSITVGSPSGTYPLYINFYTAATNRSSSILTPAPADLIINEQGALVAGGSTGYFNPVNQYAGPAQMWTYSPLAAAFEIQVWNGSTWQDTLGFATTAGSNATYNVSFPLSSWRIACINNGSTSGNFYCAVTPAFTGSS